MARENARKRKRARKAEGGKAHQYCSPATQYVCSPYPCPFSPLTNACAPPPFLLSSSLALPLTHPMLVHRPWPIRPLFSRDSSTSCTSSKVEPRCVCMRRRGVACGAHGTRSTSGT
eukprot:6172846-Pleurochrysis_carterae.AAC.1